MNKKSIITTTAALVIGLSAGYSLSSGSNIENKPAKKSGEKEIAYWVAPMDPNYRRDEPGKSPMGMDLIPVYVGEKAGSNDVGFTIPTNVVANLGMKVETAKVEDFSPQLRVTGKAHYNEDQTSHIHVRAGGWVENLYVRSVGAKVAEGDKLFSYYSPEIATALSDYLQLQNSSKRLQDIALSRLKSYGLTDRSIDIAVKSGNPHQPITVFADRGGVITKLGIQEGGKIAGNTKAFVLTNPDSMWMIADVYPQQAPLIEKKQTVTLDNGQVTSVDYIYPDTEEKLQTLKVRMILGNSEGAIKAGQYMAATIATKSEDQLTIPSSAIIRLGNMDRVILSHGEGKFEAAEIVTGASSEGRTVVTSGLKKGEKVVVSGQFMLDSESSFSGASIRMADAKAVEIESEAFAMGTINSVDVKASKVNITHPDIPEIGWPTMTMDMDVVNGIDLTKIKSGAKVHFGLGKNADGMYVITVIHLMDKMSMDGGDM